jgi:guanine deaminase
MMTAGGITGEWSVMAANRSPASAIRGPALTFTGDPFKDGLEHRMVYESDAIVAFGGGVITHFGPANKIRSQLPPGIAIKEYGPDSLISAG